MIRNAKAFAPLVASVAAAVAAAAISVALLGTSPAQAQSTDQVKADFARAVYLERQFALAKTNETTAFTIVILFNFVIISPF